MTAEGSAIFAGSASGVLARLSSTQPNLRESERKIGDYLMHHAVELVHLSITELADVTGTSEASVMRFARTLGFSGFSALKIALALELQSSSAPAPGELTADDDIAAIKRKTFSTSVSSLEDTLHLLDDAALDQAVAAIAGARRVEFYGVGSSAALAQFACAQLLQIGVPVVAVGDPHTQLWGATRLRPGDVGFAISQSGSTHDTVETLETAREAGATCVCLTRHARSPLSKVADITLLAGGRAQLEAGLELVGRVAELAVIDAIWVALTLRGGEASRQALARGRQTLNARKRF
ncbi:MAG TPA: MurR/RpiR family transcriptional regulator [Candidatus Dormibacteraeota bacterium]|jgi:DNA-binding MurR/RpiR family transcriptional regulator|nr:MurR/RpiR family transcriptional regulator [Candidatus Dormibacteraeota bacterium]